MNQCEHFGSLAGEEGAKNDWRDKESGAKRAHSRTLARGSGAKLTKRMPGARSVVARSEIGIRMLLLQPAQELLVTRITKDFFHGVVFVTELIVRPRFVNEIFARAASRNGFASAFATRHHVMSACGDVAFAEFALVGL